MALSRTALPINYCISHDHNYDVITVIKEPHFGAKMRNNLTKIIAGIRMNSPITWSIIVNKLCDGNALLV